MAAKQTTQISVRMSPALEDFLERWGQAQEPEAKPRAVARFAIEVFKAITDQLGGAGWLEITRAAADERTDVGTFIGSLLRTRIDAERKGRK